MKKVHKQFDYITALERVNDQLVVTLKFCVDLLRKFEFLAPDPKRWEAMMKNLNSVLEAAEIAREEKTFH